MTCPTLVLRGAESDVVSEFLAKHLVEGLTRSDGGDGAQLVSIEGVGHAPSLAEPEALDALEDFLSAVPAI